MSAAVLKEARGGEQKACHGHSESPHDSRHARPCVGGPPHQDPIEEVDHEPVTRSTSSRFQVATSRMPGIRTTPDAQAGRYRGTTATTSTPFLDLAQRMPSAVVTLNRLSPIRCLGGWP